MANANRYAPKNALITQATNNAGSSATSSVNPNRYAPKVTNPLTRQYNQTESELNVKPITPTLEEETVEETSSKKLGSGRGGTSLEEFNKHKQQAVKEGSGAITGAIKSWAGNLLDFGNTVSNYAEEKWGNPYSNVDTSKEAEKPASPLSKPKMSHEEFLARQYKSNKENAQSTADKLAEESAKEIETARNSGGENNKLMNVATDLVTNATQMGLDIGTGLLTGGASVPLFIRSSGGAMREAKQDGATTGQQMAYGLAKGSIETLTEKLFDGLGGTYGKGLLDSPIAKSKIGTAVVNLVGNSPLKQSVLKLGTSILSEAGEEGLSSALDPLAKAIYDNGKAAQDIWYNNNGAAEDYWRGIGYDALIGGLMGGFFSAGKVFSANENAVSQLEEFLKNTKQMEGSRHIMAMPEVMEAAPHPMALPQIELNRNTDPSALNRILAKDSKYSKAASEILHDVNALDEYESTYGKVMGDSLAEKQKNLTAALYLTMNSGELNMPQAPQGVQRNVSPDVPQTLAGANNPMAMPNTLEGANNPMAMPQMEGADPNTEGQIGAVMRIREMAKTGLTYNNATEIIDNPVMRRAFEDVYDVKLDSNRGKAKEQIVSLGKTLDVEQKVAPTPVGTDIPSSPAKHLGTSSANPLFGSHQGRSAYEKTHNVVNPEKNTSGEHQPPYIPKHAGQTENVTAPPTFDNPLISLRPNPQQNSPINTVTQNAQNSVNNATDSVTQEIAQPTAEMPTQEVKPKVNQEQTATQQTPSQNAPQNPLTATATPATAYDFGNDQAVTQDTIIQSNLNKAEYGAVGGDTTHTVHHDVDVDAFAQAKIDNDPIAARDELLTKVDYDDVDVATSNKIIADEVAKARELVANGNAEEANNIWSSLAELRKARERGLTKIAQALRQAGRLKSTFQNVTDDIISDATTQLYGEDSNLRKNVTAEDKARLMNEITAYADRLQNAKNGTVDDTISLIHDVSATRKTTSLISDTDLKIVDDVLREIAGFEDGKTFLDNVATTQIKSIAGDYTKSGFIDSVKAIRYLNALNNPKTPNANVFANFIFGNTITPTSNNFGSVFDALFSIATGKRAVPFDKSILSKETWQGANEAMKKSFAEVVLDAEADQATYAYDEIKGTHFKMVGNWFERFLATVEKYQGLMLKTTDQMAKGGIEAETKRGLSEVNKNLTAEEIADIAKEEAEYRTLQTDSKVSQALVEIKNWLNKKFHVGNAKTGTIGVGDHFIMFAQVPANAVVTQLQLQPALAGIDALGNVAKMIVESQTQGEVSVKTQRKTAMSLGRTVNGAALIGAAYLLSSIGCIRCVDEDDDDLAAMLKAEGKTGTQWNVSATLRLLTGGDTQTLEGDKWMSLSWIPQLNAMAITASALYNSKLDDGTISIKDVMYATGKGLIKSMEDFPAVSGISSTIKSWKYAKYEGEDREQMTEAERSVADTEAKLGAVAGNELSNIITSIAAPAFVRGIASGTDNKERNLYSSNNPLTRTKDNVMSAYPWLREKVPVKIDNFGNEVTNEGGLLHLANKTLLPGAITQDRATEAQAFTEKMVNKLDDTSIVPNKSAPSTVNIKINGVDQKVSLTEEERTTWQKTYGSTIESLYVQANNSEAFNSLPDDVQGYVMKDLMSISNGLASAEFKKNRGAEYKNDTYNLLNLYDSKGKDYTPLQAENIVDYYCAKEMFENSIDTDDYEGIDKVVSSYSKMNRDLQAVLGERVEGLNNYIKANKAGVKSESWTKYKDEVDAIQWAEDTKSDGSRLKYKAIVDSDIPMADKQKLINMDGEISKNWKMADKVLSAEGFNKQQIYDFFSNADWTYSEKSDEYNANGQLGAYEAFVALQKTIPDDEAMRRRIFDAFVEATGEAGRYDGWSRNLKDINKWKKYDYDYCKQVIDNYGDSSYGAWNKDKTPNALTNQANPFRYKPSK